MVGSSRNVFKNEPEFPSVATGWRAWLSGNQEGPLQHPAQQDGCRNVVFVCWGCSF